MHRCKKHEENYIQVHHIKNKEQAKNKEPPPKNLKRNQRKETHYTGKNTGMDDSRFLIRDNTSRERRSIFKVLREKNCQPRILLSAKIPFKK